MELYQFPISHYCEKARWALDLKGQRYTVCNLLPGPHIKAVRKLVSGRDPSLPVLVDGDDVIQGSAAIIDHLDDRIPTPALTPVGSNEAARAREWELYLDQEIGIHARRLVYHHILDHPTILPALLRQGAPWHWPLYRLRLSKVRAGMRRFLNVNAETAAASQIRVVSALRRLDEALLEGRFLVGGVFTRADLTAAALTAPFTRPQAYGLDWSMGYPQDLEDFIAQERERPWFQWAEGLYRDYRKPDG